MFCSDMVTRGLGKISRGSQGARFGVREADSFQWLQMDLHLKGRESVAWSQRKGVRSRE